LIIVWTISRVLSFHEGHEGIEWLWNNGFFSVLAGSLLIAIAQAMIMARGGKIVRVLPLVAT